VKSTAENATGIRRNMGQLITPDGGGRAKLSRCYRDTAQVLLLSDKEGGAGAIAGEFAHFKAR